MINVSTLRPGLLVSLHTSLTGNVLYKTRELEADHVDEEGARRARWETDRTIQLPAEHEAGTKARSKARSLITAICSPSSFGLLCPEANREQLDKAVAEAREVAEQFNAGASLTRVGVYVIVGRVAADDVEAVRAINSEVRELLTTMETGLQKLDVEAVRTAANKARSLAAMLTPEAAERAELAIAAARGMARRMVKAGEAAAQELDEATLRRIRQARTAFLDLGPETEVKAPETNGRAIDFEMADMPIAQPAAPAVALEL